MRFAARQLQRILLQVALLLAIWFLCHCGFVLVNIAHFKGLGLSGFFRLCFYALRYDLSAIFAVNAIYILLFLLPLPIWQMPRWEKGTQWLFLIVNGVALFAELGDWAYYPYNFKRATADVLKLVSRKGDFWNMFPGYLVSYWYLPLIWLLLLFLLKKMNDRIRKKTSLANTSHWRAGIFFAQIAALGLAAGASLLAIRGGVQYIPIGLRNAVQVTDSKYVPVVVNTPFSIITTLASPGLEEVHYMPDAEAAALIPLVKNYSGRHFAKKNVVIIILESFSKEFTKLGGGISFTPFLDSLMGHSLICTQAYANGLHSAEGIPAVLSGIPTLMDEPFTTSDYGTNHITALPAVLKAEGYSTAFYHGGTNGTMSFDIFASAAGFEHYYGRKEYADERDYDGAWGIWDEPFLQYFSAGLSRMKQPFMASVFTLSSHPPYSIPAVYKNTFPKGTLPIHQTVGYTDAALRKFFASASSQPWFSNTLFVISPDHCSPQTTGGYWSSVAGMNAIPILFFAPGDALLKGYNDQLMQQIDILPTTLDYLGYNKRFFAFGNSLFDTAAPHFVVNRLSGDYSWQQTNWLLQTHDIKPFGLYDFRVDSACSINLLRSNITIAGSRLRYLEAFIQLYRDALIHNKMWVQP